MPEIRKIDNHRHLPRVLWRQKQQRILMDESKRRKEGNRRKHTQFEKQDHRSKKSKSVVKQEK